MSVGVIHSADEPALLLGHLRSLARHRLVAVPFRGKALRRLSGSLPTDRFLIPHVARHHREGVGVHCVCDPLSHLGERRRSTLLRRHSTSIP
jgi:hypothetical protein